MMILINLKLNIIFKGVFFMDGFYVGDIIGNSYTHENEKYNKKTERK